MGSVNLPHRGVLQRPGGSRDAVGGRVTTWTNVATVFMQVRPLNTTERQLAAQRNASTSHVVTIRYAAQVSAVASSWRILWGARILVLDGDPINVDEKSEYLELNCVEGLRSE